jgi:hypothetical protein
LVPRDIPRKIPDIQSHFLSYHEKNYIKQFTVEVIKRQTIISIKQIVGEKKSVSDLI